MPNVIALPQSASFNDTLVAFGSSMAQPKDCRYVPIYIAWNNVTTQAPGYLFEIPDTPSMPKNIATVYVDNSRCSSGIYIIFPDSGFRITVPALRRGYYPAVTASLRFYVGMFNPAGANAFDKTTVMALNFLVPPQESDATILTQHWSITFDSSAAVGSTLINTPPTGASTTGNYRLRSCDLQLAGMTATAAGFACEFNLFADGTRIIKADLLLAANEFVDANMLVSRDNMQQISHNFTFTWTISAGALVGIGIANLDVETDAADVI